MNEPITIESILAQVKRLEEISQPPQIVLGQPGSFAGLEPVPGMRFYETELAPIGQFRMIPDVMPSLLSRDRPKLFITDPDEKPDPFERIQFRMQYELPILRPQAFTRICVDAIGPTVAEMRASRAYWRGKKRAATTQARKQRKARRLYLRHAVRQRFSQSLKENHGPLSGKV